MTEVKLVNYQFDAEHNEAYRSLLERTYSRYNHAKSTIAKRIKLKEKTKFWMYLLFVTIITVPIESILLKTGLRSYASDLTNTFSGFTIPLTQAPIEILLAVPIIATLVIAFYKYIEDY